MTWDYCLIWFCDTNLNREIHASLLSAGWSFIAAVAAIWIAFFQNKSNLKQNRIREMLEKEQKYYDENVLISIIPIEIKDIQSVLERNHLSSFISDWNDYSAYLKVYKDKNVWKYCWLIFPNWRNGYISQSPTYFKDLLQKTMSWKTFDLYPGDDEWFLIKINCVNDALKEYCAKIIY